MSEETLTGQHRALTAEDRLVTLEKHDRDSLIERAGIVTTLRILGVIISISAAGVVGGAISVYSKALTTEQRVIMCEGRTTAIEAAVQRKDSDDRLQRDQAAENRSDVRAIRVQLDEVLRRLDRADADRVPARQQPR